MTRPYTPCAMSDPDDRVALWPCVAVMVVCILAVTVLAVWPRTGQPVAIVFAPFLTLDQIDARIVQAGGALVDFGTLQGVVVGLSTNADFAQKLYGQGALWVMDHSFAAGLCVTPNV